MNGAYFWNAISYYSEIVQTYTNGTLAHPHFQQLLRSDAHFDVVIIEYFMCDAFLGLGHHFNAPVIILTSQSGIKRAFDFVGSPVIPSFMPNLYTSLSDRMTFWERARNLLYYCVQDIGMSLINDPKQQAVLDANFPDDANMPSLEALQRNVALVLLNTHVSYGGPRPYAPNMIEIGGIHIERNVQPLPSHLQVFLDGATAGAIFFSLGSNLEYSTMPLKNKQAISNAFTDFPKMRLLLKLDENIDILSHNASEIIVQSWLPQQSILAHPNVKLFISHGGGLSTAEAIYFGKPILGIPVFGDQHMNMKTAAMSGFGVNLPYEELTAPRIREALREVLSNPSYANKAILTSDRYKDQIATPMATAIHWVKHVAKNKGAPHLHSAAIDLPFYAYHNLDIFSALFAVICLMFILLRAFYRIHFARASLAKANKKIQ